MAEPSTRPLPVMQPESDFYWERAKAHELWICKCNTCGRAFFYPRTFCPFPNCASRDVIWIQSSGRGTLHTFAIVERPPLPTFREHVPYVVALVDLEEGVRVPTNLMEVQPDPQHIKIGMPVEVVFDDVTNEVTLPKFRPGR